MAGGALERYLAMFEMARREDVSGLAALFSLVDVTALRGARDEASFLAPFLAAAYRTGRPALGLAALAGGAPPDGNGLDEGFDLGTSPGPAAGGGRTPLAEAAAFPSPRGVLDLLARGANPNVRSSEWPHRTALFHAAPETVVHLLQAGAKPWLLDAAGEDALTLCATGRRRAARFTDEPTFGRATDDDAVILELLRAGAPTSRALEAVKARGCPRVYIAVALARESKTAASRRAAFLAPFAWDRRRAALVAWVVVRC